MSKRPCFRKRRKESGVEQNIGKRDYPLVRKTIIENSLSDKYEDARREWDFQNIIYEDDFDFVDRCELCHQPGVKKNYILLNIENSKILKVGSRCIKRFIVLSGAATQEESNDLFLKKEKDIFAAQQLHYYLAPILSDLPTAREVSRFRNASKQILGTIDNKELGSKPREWKYYLRLLFGKENPQKELVERVKLVLFGKPRVKREKLITGEKEGSWAGKTRPKKTRVKTTLSSSDAYKNPAKNR